MILYYTRTQKTKIFAEALHDILDMPLYELKSELDDMKDFKFLLRALRSVLTSNECKATNIPKPLPEEIYLCAPIWGGKIAAPAQYFLKYSDLSSTKVNLLVTASTPVEKYRARAQESLSQINCIPGNAYIFATGKGLPEKDVVLEHLRDILNK